MKGKGERERYTQLNEEFQRIERKDKKAFNEQCQEVEENNRMGKSRNLFKKTSSRNVQVNISCKDGHDKGQKQ